MCVRVYVHVHVRVGYEDSYILHIIIFFNLYLNEPKITHSQSLCNHTFAHIFFNAYGILGGINIYIYFITHAFVIGGC